MTAVQPLNVPRPVKLRTGDFMLLSEAGAFADYAKTELIEGEIYYMNAQHRPHSYAKTQLFLRIAEALKKAGSALDVLVEASVAMPPHDMPEPDIVVTSEPRGTGPVPLASVALIVEVADTTLERDLGRKAALYARHGIPEYWVVDLENQEVSQMWGTGAEEYLQRRKVVFGETVVATTVGGLRTDTIGL